MCPRFHPVGLTLAEGGDKFGKVAGVVAHAVVDHALVGIVFGVSTPLSA
jgi:hypothetical protein